MVVTVILASVSLFLLILSAALTAALTAVLKISETEARILADEGFAGADSLLALRADKIAGSPLSVLRTLCALGSLATGLAAVLAAWGQGDARVWFAGSWVLAAAFLVGDLIPRGLGSRKPVALALKAAPFLRSGSGHFGRLLAPLHRLLSGARDDTGPPADEAQVREALEIGSDAGIVEAEEHLLVERAFKLDELDAHDAMTPRVDILAWKDSKTLDEIIPELSEVPHSRVPVYGESIDDVTGILHVRQAYAAHVAGKGSVRLSDLAREAMFVPGSLSLAKLLAEFRARRVHMGIVADEFGGTDGLITLEDVLEELVGDIVDETDVEEDPLTQLSGDEIVASGGADLREINERFALALPVGENRSLNGFILEELGKVPEPGVTLEAGGTRIEVLAATDTQVVRARLRPLASDRRDR